MRTRTTREPLVSSMVTEDVGMTGVKTLCLECGHEGLVIVQREGLPYSVSHSKTKTEAIFKQHLCKMRVESYSMEW